MEYKKGCIVMKSRACFRDGTYDPHSQRPAMVTIASDDISNETYHLLLTSQIQHYILHSDEYYLLTEGEWKGAGLPRPSMIKLDKVYKEHVSGQKKGGLPPATYRQIIQKLKEYKQDHPGDLVYEEIKGVLK